ncbi:PP2C family protein-serine/threonine phosphatase [Luteolibacter algae]|uniref:PP2C family protein-serine/threonine phosphatase n=1 Tax=Luteolibacter algae TaxID=454151 RepID=A0ABW5DAN1_9BACT
MSQQDFIKWAGTTVSGSRKPRNDDSWIVFSSDLNGAKKLPDAGESSVHKCDLVFAVSDGMGGGNAGDMASALIIERMAAIIPETFKAAASGFYPDCIAHLEDAIKEVHDHINEAAGKADDQKGMAATLALVWFTPDNMYLANVGDSRIYRSRAGKTEQLSKDHTAAWASWKRGDIQEVQYRTHPRRSALYEVVGGGYENLRPYFAAIPYQPGDRFLICSDGLVDGVWERHISNALAANREPTETCEILLKRAIDNSGIDDTTLVVIHID